MKKLPLILSLFALIFCFAFTANDWKPVKLQAGMTVKMPGTVTEEKMQGDLVVHKTQLDSLHTLTAMVMDYTRFGLTAEVLQQLSGTDEFMEQLQTGIETSGATVTAARKGQYRDLPYCEFEVEREQEGTKMQSLVRIVFFRQWGINLTYKYRHDKKSESVPTQFFNSLEVSK